VQTVTRHVGDVPLDVVATQAAVGDDAIELREQHRLVHRRQRGERVAFIVKAREQVCVKRRVLRAMSQQAAQFAALVALQLGLRPLCPCGQRLAGAQCAQRESQTCDCGHGQSSCTGVINDRASANWPST
jgi:hypothetical protein